MGRRSAADNGQRTLDSGASLTGAGFSKEAAYIILMRTQYIPRRDRTEEAREGEGSKYVT